MTDFSRKARFRVIPALALLATLAACGVDGEPETPTRSDHAPSALIAAGAHR